MKKEQKDQKKGNLLNNPENQYKEEIRNWIKKTTYYGNMEEIVDFIYRNYPTNNVRYSKLF